ncbi:MAG: hypothetical protein JNN05_09645, partial [Candidatus Omnitrophica bacterium]|nr:hypothetical protein [Candidatus Omnitrophota bacterium]
MAKRQWEFKVSVQRLGTRPEEYSDSVILAQVEIDWQRNIDMHVYLHIYDGAAAADVLNVLLSIPNLPSDVRDALRNLSNRFARSSFSSPVDDRLYTNLTFEHIQDVFELLNEQRKQRNEIEFAINISWQGQRPESHSGHVKKEPFKGDLQYVRTSAAFELYDGISAGEFLAALLRITPLPFDLKMALEDLARRFAKTSDIDEPASSTIIRKVQEFDASFANLYRILVHTGRPVNAQSLIRAWYSWLFDLLGSSDGAVRSEAKRTLKSLEKDHLDPNEWAVYIDGKLVDPQENLWVSNVNSYELVQFRVTSGSGNGKGRNGSKETVSEQLHKHLLQPVSPSVKAYKLKVPLVHRFQESKGRNSFYMFVDDSLVAELPNLERIDAINEIIKRLLGDLHALSERYSDRELVAYAKAHGLDLDRDTLRSFKKKGQPKYLSWVIRLQEVVALKLKDEIPASARALRGRIRELQQFGIAQRRVAQALGLTKNTVLNVGRTRNSSIKTRRRLENGLKQFEAQKTKLIELKTKVNNMLSRVPQKIFLKAARNMQRGILMRFLKTGWAQPHTIQKLQQAVDQLATESGKYFSEEDIESLRQSISQIPRQWQDKHIAERAVILGFNVSPSDISYFRSGVRLGHHKLTGVKRALQSLKDEKREGSSSPVIKAEKLRNIETILTVIAAQFRPGVKTLPLKTLALVRNELGKDKKKFVSIQAIIRHDLKLQKVVEKGFTSEEIRSLRVRVQNVLRLMHYYGALSFVFSQQSLARISQKTPFAFSQDVISSLVRNKSYEKEIPSKREKAVKTEVKRNTIKQKAVLARKKPRWFAGYKMRAGPKVVYYYNHDQKHTRSPIKRYSSSSPIHSATPSPSNHVLTPVYIHDVFNLSADRKYGVLRPIIVPFFDRLIIFTEGIRYEISAGKSFPLAVAVRRYQVGVVNKRHVYWQGEIINLGKGSVKGRIDLRVDRAGNLGNYQAVITDLGQSTRPIFIETVYLNQRYVSLQAAQVPSNRYRLIDLRQVSVLKVKPNGQRFNVLWRLPRNNDNFPKIPFDRLSGDELYRDMMLGRIKAIEWRGRPYFVWIVALRYRNYQYRFMTYDQMTLLNKRDRDLSNGQVSSAVEDSKVPDNERVALRQRLEKVFQQGVSLLESGKTLSPESKKSMRQEALMIFNEALSISIHLKDIQRELDSANTLAQLHFFLNQWDYAIQYWEHVVSVSQEVSEHVFYNLALSYAERILGWHQERRHASEIKIDGQRAILLLEHYRTSSEPARVGLETDIYLVLYHYAETTQLRQQWLNEAISRLDWTLSKISLQVPDVHEALIGPLLIRRQDDDINRAIQSLDKALSLASGETIAKVRKDIFNAILNRYLYLTTVKVQGLDEETSQLLVKLLRHAKDNEMTSVTKLFSEAFRNYRRMLDLQEVPAARDPVLHAFQAVISSENVHASIRRKTFVLLRSVVANDLPLRLIYLQRLLLDWVGADKKERLAIKQEWRRWAVVNEREGADQKHVRHLENMRLLGQSTNDADLSVIVETFATSVKNVLVNNELILDGKIVLRLDEKTQTAVIDVEENMTSDLKEKAEKRIRKTIKEWGVKKVDLGMTEQWINDETMDVIGQILESFASIATNESQLADVVRSHLTLRKLRFNDRVVNETVGYTNQLIEEGVLRRGSVAPEELAKFLSEIAQYYLIERHFPNPFYGLSSGDIFKPVLIVRSQEADSYYSFLTDGRAFVFPGVVIVPQGILNEKTAKGFGWKV